MRTIGNLKLPEEHIGRFKAALEYYEIEPIGSFLRRCAYLIIRHAEAGEAIAQPWSLKTVNPQPCEPASPPPKSKRNKGKSK